MEEVMVMMMPSNENPCNETIHEEQPISSTATCSSWKLYENPFYYSEDHQNHHQHQQQSTCRSVHNLQSSPSTRRIAASFWDLTFFKPSMESELDVARSQITDLKAEIEYERKARKKVESMNKKLARELSEERMGREALERVCERLAREISSSKAEVDRMKREIEDERKMLRMAEVLREERVQMKMAEAKLLFEEKLLELEEARRTSDASSSKTEQKNQEDATLSLRASSTSSKLNLSGKFPRLNLGDQSSCHDYTNCADSRAPTRSALVEKSSSSENISGRSSSSMGTQRRTSPETQNPHIKRGIKGFVEFPRVVRAIGSKSRHWSAKLECQKAQLRILLKHKSPIRSNNLIMS